MDYLSHNGTAHKIQHIYNLEKSSLSYIYVDYIPQLWKSIYLLDRNMLLNLNFISTHEMQFSIMPYKHDLNNQKKNPYKTVAFFTSDNSCLAHY